MKNRIVKSICAIIILFSHCQISYGIQSYTKASLAVIAAGIVAGAGALIYHHRTTCDTTPTITATWADNGETRYGIQSNIPYTARSAHFKPSVFFNLYQCMQERYHVPEGGIQCCDGTVVSREELHIRVELLLAEIAHKRTEYTYFTVLKNGNFVLQEGHGALIVKFKDYPLVLKLFIEKPETILNPFIKDFEELFFYVIGGGINRYFAGFTRVENRERIQKTLDTINVPNELVLPLKYIWLPSQESAWDRKIKLVGVNCGAPGVTQEIMVPAVYGIIAEYIPLKRSFSWLNSGDRAQAMQISNAINGACHALCVDQNIPNYAETNSGKIALVDTEHFGILLGFEPGDYCFSNYPSFWAFCAAKLFKDGFKYIVQWQ